jgi:hypothetical protein
MSTLDQARETQLNNIQARTGKSLAELTALIQSSGLTKHGEIRDMLIRELGLGYGDATMLVHFALQSDGQSAAEAKGVSIDEVVDEFYSGAKADLRPIHDELMTAISQFGEFEVVPKRGYVSLRRKRQFAMIGPATKTRVEVGINSKTLEATDRLLGMPPGGMCQFKVNVTEASQVDAELIAWIKQGYDSAG